MKLRHHFVLVLLFCTSALSFSKVQIPDLSSPIIDQAGIFSAGEKQQLELTIRKIKAQGPQVQVWTLGSLDGETIEQLSIRAAEKWKLGSKKKGNGVLLTVALQDRKMRIEVGEGLEGQLTDIESHQIIKNYIAPNFKRQNYYLGTMSFLLVTAKKLGIEIHETQAIPSRGRNQDYYVKKKNFKEKRKFGPILIFFFLFIYPIFFSKMKKRPMLRGILSAVFFTLFGLLFFGFVLKLLLFILFFGFTIGLAGPGALLRGGAYYGGGYGGRGGFGGGGFGGGGWSGGGGGFSGGGSSGGW